MAEEFMKWRPDFNLGIEKIDDQHKKIVELINKLNTAFMQDQARERLGGIFSELIDYADYHFRDEEALFSAYNFPFTEEHKRMHQGFIRKIQDLKKNFEEGQSVTYRLMGFLRKWLTDHILDADREYAALVRSRS